VFNLRTNGVFKITPCGEIKNLFILQQVLYNFALGGGGVLWLKN
jgi:hypothetical protein